MSDCDHFSCLRDVCPPPQSRRLEIAVRWNRLNTILIYSTMYQLKPIAMCLL